MRDAREARDARDARDARCKNDSLTSTLANFSKSSVSFEPLAPPNSITSDANSCMGTYA